MTVLELINNKEFSLILFLEMIGIFCEANISTPYGSYTYHLLEH
jgi:hypothetical protein